MRINPFTAYTPTSTLNKTMLEYQNSLQNLSSGKKVNHAADNPAALVILQGMQAQTNGLNQAYDNTQNSISLFNTASGAMSSSTDALQDMRTLAVKAGNGILTASDRSYIQGEMNQLSAQIDSNAANTQFNGINTNDGTLTDFVTQTGANQGQTSFASIPDVSLAALGTATDVSTQAVSQTTLASIDTSLQSITSAQAKVGSLTNALKSSANNTLQSSINMQNSASVMGDTDMALQNVRLNQVKLQQYTAIMLQAKQFHQSQGILSLTA